MKISPPGQGGHGGYGFGVTLLTFKEAFVLAFVDIDSHSLGMRYRYHRLLRPLIPKPEPVESRIWWGWRY